MRSVILFFLGFVGLFSILMAVRGPPVENAGAASAEPEIALRTSEDVLSRGRYIVKRIDRVSWGEKWPFTVDHAYLVCVPEIEASGQFMIVGGRAYAATGGSQRFAVVHALTIEFDGRSNIPTLFGNDDSEADRWWREAPRPEGLAEGEPWYRVSIAPVHMALVEMGCK